MCTLLLDLRPALNEPDRRWTPRIAAHRAGDDDATRDLLRDSLRAVDRVSRRYPDVYFELARKTPEAVASLGHRVFCRLDGRSFGRFPFSGRTPFDAFVAETMGDRDVRYHSFEARLSIAREALREQYAFNVRHHPEWAAKEELHKAVVQACRDHCATWPGRNPRYPRYGLTSWRPGPRVPRDDWDRDDVVRVVTRRGAWPVRSQVDLVLAKRGCAMYPAEISAILQDASVASADSSIDPEDLAGSPMERALDARLSVRRVLSERWGQLDADQQRLVAMLVAGKPYREIVDAIDRYRDPSSCTRALAKICDAFIGDLGERLGVATGVSLRPRQAAEVLLPALMELPEVKAALEEVS